jgi:hypothetical protein
VLGIGIIGPKDVAAAIDTDIVWVGSDSDLGGHATVSRLIENSADAIGARNAKGGVTGMGTGEGAHRVGKNIGGRLANERRDNTGEQKEEGAQMERVSH